MIALITGEIGIGKTTACQRAIDLLRARGVMVGGILAPARRDANGVKIGIDAKDVTTGARRPLADLVPNGGKTIGDYTFDPETMDWALTRLLAIASASKLTEPSSVLVVDEIGPLELVRRDGFAEVLSPLSNPNLVPRALLVVRREYEDILERRLGRPDLCRYRVDEAHRDHLPAEIAAVLLTQQT
jgi:nucleoside-triphosphatase THEP1